MGQALALAVVGLGAAGAYGALRLKGDQLRTEPRHAPGHGLGREAGSPRGQPAPPPMPPESSDGAEALTQEGLPQAPPDEDPAAALARADAERRGRMVEELRAIREQAERARREREERDLCGHPLSGRAGGAVGSSDRAWRQECEADRRRYPRPTWLTTEGCINVAVTGNSGVGKSSFINTVRGLRARDPGAADVSPNETTMEPRAYEFGDLAAPTRLWDLPGAGTRRFPRETYTQTMGLRYFDVVIIVTASRYTETEILIAEELQRFNVPYIMVRNKVDADVTNNEEDHGTPADETLESIRADMQQQGVGRPYLISSKLARSKDFDLDQLKADALLAISTARDVSHEWLQGAALGGS